MPLEPDATELGLRDRLADHEFLANARASAPAGFKLRSQEDFKATLDRMLSHHRAGDPIHVFAYGSLMWNPALEHDTRSRARIYGWHRSFCVRNLIGRGAPECPGLMLALDKGGSCNGVLLRIPGPKVDDELALLWRREMTWGTYDARWVTAWGDSGPVRAVTFVVDRRHERYAAELTPQEAARMINTGRGALGTCRAYFDATLQTLRDLGIHDEAMERLGEAVRQP